jgi:hypothetical protein
VTKKHRTSPAGPDTTAVLEAIETLLGELWDALNAGGLLESEMATAACIMLPLGAEADPETSADAFIELAGQSRRPEDAAMLRLIVSLGSPAVKRAASKELGDLTADGIYPADWVTEAGKATPLRATRHSDAFDELQVITVTYSYGGSEHVVAVAIASVDYPQVVQVSVTADVAAFVPFPGAVREEEISLAEARRRMEPALDDTEGGLQQYGPEMVYLPIARSRLRRLPAPDAAEARRYTAAERSALVDEFMASGQAVDAVAADAAATRFWAEILTAYSSRIPDEPPGLVGPHRMRDILGEHVPTFYPVTQAQRAQLRPAVTAWAAWSAQHWSVPDAAGELAGAADQAIVAFEKEPDDPYYAALRGYLADLVTSDADVEMLRMAMVRRTLALPLPDDRPDETGSLDAADPATRRTVAAAEFATCTLPDGVTRDQLIAAAQRVVEELWTGEPPATWQHAERLSINGMDHHDIIHALTNLLACRGSTGLPAGDGYAGQAQGAAGDREPGGDLAEDRPRHEDDEGGYGVGGRAHLARRGPGQGVGPGGEAEGGREQPEVHDAERRARRSAAQLGDELAGEWQAGRRADEAAERGHLHR